MFDNSDLILALYTLCFLLYTPFMELKTFVFIGRSGSGKGTQARLLEGYIKDVDSLNNVLYLETGARFRDFLKDSNYTAKLSQEIYKRGDLQPDFLAIRIWADELQEKLSGDEHLIFDGTPRQLREAYVLETALDFYQRKDVYIVYPNVSRKWSEEKLSKRGREDDKNLEEIKKRLDWYDEKVLPVIEYYRGNPRYHFLDINGEQTIEEVHNNIVEKVFKK